MDIKKHGHNIQQKLVNVLDIPNDVVLDLPKLTMIGNVQLYIENHRGIISYAPDNIRIASSIGEIAIIGEGLTIRNISRDEIHLDGEISSFFYHR